MKSVENSKVIESKKKAIIFPIIEIVIVLFPLYLGLYLSDYLGLDHIPLWNDIVIIGGYVQYLGLFASLILLYIVSKKRKGKLKDFGIKKPTSWIKTIVMGLIVSLIIFVVVAFAINPVINMIFPDQIRDMSRFSYLEGNLPNLVIQLVIIWITAAFLEELLFRGYMIERLLGIDAKPKIVKIIVVLVIGSVIFGFAHLYQGPMGMIRTGVIGFVFGACYFITKRSLLPLILAHGLIDTMDMISHYLGS